MNILNTIPLREVQKNWSSVIKKVNNGKDPLVVMSNNKPQAVIVSLNYIKKNKVDENSKSLKHLLALSGVVKGLPADLSEKHDDYIQ